MFTAQNSSLPLCLGFPNFLKNLSVGCYDHEFLIAALLLRTFLYLGVQAITNMSEHKPEQTRFTHAIAALLHLKSRLAACCSATPIITQV